MEKSILMSFSPYWYYLIGEGIKKIELRKVKPKSKDWSGTIECYMTKDEKSFKKIPKEFQEKYRKHFGKVGMQIVCGEIYKMSYSADYIAEYLFFSHADKSIKESQDLDAQKLLADTCLSMQEAIDYMGKKRECAGLHISNLKIYDTPRELGEFRKLTPLECSLQKHTIDNTKPCAICGGCKIKRPPQSWCYVEK